MAEKVEVRGGGQLDGAIFQNAASEATLQRILDALGGGGNRSGGGTGGGSGGASGSNAAAKAQGLYNRMLNEGSDELKKSTATGELFGKTLNSASTAASKMGSAISGIAATGLGMVFSGIALAGNTLVSFLSQGLDAYREASQVGGGFNNNLIELSTAAARARMPLADFVKVITNNSSTLAKFGGTVSDGASRFADLSTEFRNASGDRFFGMGYTVEDMNNSLAGYIEMQARLGNLQKMDNKALAAGNAVYLDEVEKLTRATGMSRKQMEDVAKKASVDPIISALRKGLNPEELAKSTANLGLAMQVGGQEMEDAMKSMAAGRPDELGKAMIAAGFSMEDAQKAIKGGMDPKELMQRLRLMSQTAKDMGLSGNATLNASSAMFASLQKASDNIDSNTDISMEAAAKQRDKTDQITTAMGSLSNTFQELKSGIMVALIDSGVFDMLKKGLDSLATYFNENKKSVIEFISQFTGNFMKDIQEGGLGTALQNGFKTIFEKVIPVVSDLAKSMFKGIMSAFSGGNKAAGETTPAPGGGAVAEADASPFENIKNSINELFPILKPMQTVLEGISWAFENWGKILGGLVLAGGVLALLSPVLGAAGVGLEAILAPIQAVAIAIGAAGAGLGAMFWGFSKAIEAVSTGLKELPDSLRKLGELDGDKLKSAGSGIAAISDPLVKLGAGGLLAALGGNSGLVGVADALIKFTSINIDSIRNLAEPLMNFHKALSLFTGGNEGLLSSFGSAIGNWIKGDSGLSKFADSFKAFNDVKSDNISTLAEGMNKLKTIGDDFTGQARGIDNFSSSIKKLRTELTALNTTLSSLASEGKGLFGGGTSNLEVVSKALGGATAGAATASSTASDQLNTLMTEAVGLLKEIRDSEKDSADALKGRRSPI